MISSVAHKLGISKADLLDPTSSDAAVRQAHAETHVIQETKMYFQSNGIDLKAFESRERDDRVLLIKNFPFGTKTDELLKLLGDFGEVRQLLMPPTGTIAIAEFAAAPAARAAFAGLAYRRFKDGILFLEKAPKGLFTGARTSPSAVPGATGSGIDAKISAGDLKESAAEDPATTQDVTTVFVRNLSFSTTAERFHTAFEPLRGFLWARLKTKTDPKRKPGQQQLLSMGFGFVGFDTPEHARAAIAAMDGHALDGHKLLGKISQRKDEEADKKKAATAAAAAAKGTKLVIKNLPFEATKNDVRSLFGYVSLSLSLSQNAYDGKENTGRSGRYGCQRNWATRRVGLPLRTLWRRVRLPMPSRRSRTLIYSGGGWCSTTRCRTRRTPRRRLSA